MSKDKHSQDLLALYRSMRLVRTAESSLIKLFSDSEIPGFIHLSIGQEAVAAGVMVALAEQDTVATTHRGHGHVIARGMDLDLFFKELMGKDGGICRGRGGSMHVADRSKGILGANGIVGAGIPIALGSALAHSVRGTGGVAVAFFGDGAMAEGVLHESLNMAALWKLPMLFVCENNGWSEFSQTKEQFVPELGELARAFGIPHEPVDGNDVEAVAGAARALAAQARGGGPRILECRTQRVRGHFEGDPQKYRGADEMQTLDERDPLKLAQAALERQGVARAAIEAVDAEVEAEVAAAVQAGRADAAAGLCPGVRRCLYRHPGKRIREMAEMRYMEAVNRALQDAMAADGSVIVMGEDVARAGGSFKATRGLLPAFGAQRVIDTPISESSIVSAAVGAAMTGLKPVVEIMFMDFITLAMDAIVNQAAKARFMFGGQRQRADGAAHAAWRRPERRPAAFAMPGSLVRPRAGIEGGVPGQRAGRLQPPARGNQRPRSSDFHRAQGLVRQAAAKSILP